MQYAEPSQQLLDCMKTCGECAGVCNRCSHHCLHMGQDHAGPEHQGLMRDCAELCALSACFMGRGSPHSKHVCRECAEICTRCADSCEKMAEGDEIMVECARVCRDCAATCEMMTTAQA